MMVKRYSSVGFVGVLVAALALMLAPGCSDDDDTGNNNNTNNNNTNNNNTNNNNTNNNNNNTNNNNTNNNNTNNNNNANPDMGVQDGGTMDGGSTTTVTITGSFVIFGTQTAVDGVEVCVKDKSSIPCVKSDAKGEWTLTNVPDEDLTLTVKKAGYFPFAAQYGKGQKTKSYAGTSLLTPALVTTLTSVLSTSPKTGKGHIILTSAGKSGGAAGTVIALNPKSGEGPFYMGANGLPDPTAKATTAGARAFILNADPGTYTLTFTNSTLTCAIQNGHAGSASGSLSVPVFADTGTIVSVACQ